MVCELGILLALVGVAGFAGATAVGYSLQMRFNREVTWALVRVSRAIAEGRNWLREPE